MQKDIYSKHNFRGVVSRTFIDKSNHSARTILFTNGLQVVTNPFLSAKLNTGDSIEKSVGNSFVKIFKKNGEAIVYDLNKSKVIRRNSLKTEKDWHGK